MWRVSQVSLNYSSSFLTSLRMFYLINEDLTLAMKNIIGCRDHSRRHHNLLCKPLSEFETHYFKKISYSYFKMPQDFPRSICFGRLADSEWAPLFKEIFNEDYSSLPQGSESFKFKMKNQFEDMLFKVEDEMYNHDYEIAQAQRAMDVFGEETKKIEQMDEEQKKNYVLPPHKFNKLRRRQIEKVYLDIGGYMVNTAAQQPARAVPILYNRFKSIYQQLTKPRNDLVREWFLSCEKAFHKSLDHRSFHFKAFEKKQQQAKAYINEIKAIQSQSVKSKNRNQLCGGSKDCEFFGTYASFEPINVFTDAHLNQNSISVDSPINLKDDALLEDPSVLPQMRFLFNDRQTFELALTLVLSVVHLGNQGQNEKDKIRTTLKNLIENFLCQKSDLFSKLRHLAAEVGDQALEDYKVDRIIQKDYYDLKILPEPFEFRILPKSEDANMEDQAQGDLIEQLKVKENFQSVSSYEKQGQEAAIEDKKEGEKSSEEEVDAKLSQPTQSKFSMSQQYSKQKFFTVSFKFVAQQYKRMNLQSPAMTDAQQSQRSPVYQPYFKPGYQLLLTGQNIFVFFRQLYTVYERLIKAQQIINDKVDADLSFKGDDSLKQRASEFKREKFEIFLGGVLSAISQTIDANKYEDFARSVLGNKAYLLFSFDKLIIAVSDNLNNQ